MEKARSFVGQALSPANLFSPHLKVGRRKRLPHKAASQVAL
jgi:hypothetical protein